MTNTTPRSKPLNTLPGPLPPPPYAPMPQAEKTYPAKTASTAPPPGPNMWNPAAATPIQQHPRYSTLITLIARRLIQPNLHLQETFRQALDEFDKLN